MAPLIQKYRELEAGLARSTPLTGQHLIEELFPAGEGWAAELHDLALERAGGNSSAQELRDALRTAITQPELPTDVDYVRVMSLHKSKGLTADLVVIAGCIQGGIPFVKEGLTRQQQEDALEAQRRLFFVALTRTRQTLVISSASAMPRRLAHTMRVPVRGNDRNQAIMIASTFIGELGPNLPRVLNGVELLR